MKKMIYSTLVLGALITTVSSCKKANLTRDQWKITNATDLEDNSNITSDYAGEVWEYQKDGNYVENNSVKGTWAWGDGKDKLIITETDGTVDTYNVLELKKNEMELEIPGEERLELERIQ